MKHYIFAALALFSGAIQAESLQSKSIKSGICSDAAYTLQDEYRFQSFDEKSCMNGGFNVVEKLYDQATSELTLMKISFEFSQKNLEVNGKAIAVRSFKVDATGQVSKSWVVRSTTIDVSDQRSFASIINQMFDGDDFNFGNGDGGVSQVASSMTEAEIIKDIEEALPSDEEGCQYATTSEKKWALNDLDDHSEELADYIRTLEKDGKVKAVVSRTYDDGESEYCSHYYFRILLEDGTYIYLDLDFTTQKASFLHEKIRFYALILDWGIIRL